MSLATADMNEQVTHVLAVDDSAADRNLLRLSLSDSSQRYRLEYAERLSEGLSKLGKQGVDVVLLDLNLPDSQGRDTIKQVMQHAAHVPVLVLTGSDDDCLALEAVRAGAQDYIVKGQISTHALSRAMRYAIERHNVLMASRQTWRQSESEDELVIQGSSEQNTLLSWVRDKAVVTAAKDRCADPAECVLKSRQGYEGFVIEARVHKRTGAGFSVEISIEDHDRSGVRETNFYIPNIFEAAESAMATAIETGRQRIDAGLWN